MPKITAHSKIFRDWEGLLGACAQNAPLLPGMETLKTELETFLAQVKEMKIQQEALTAQRVALTQRLVALEKEGEESARKLRAFVFSHLGSRTEALKQFGIVPGGQRARKASAGKPVEESPAEAASHPSTPAGKAGTDHNG